MKKDEDSIDKINNNNALHNNNIDESYSKYMIDDLDFISKSSKEDIETKMNKMIDEIKKGKNLYNINIKNKNNDAIIGISQIGNEENKYDEKKEKNEKKKILNNKRKINSSSLKKYDNDSEAEKLNKITLKRKKLELLKKKEENYLDIINIQSKLRKDNIKNLEKQLSKQKNKNDNLKKGIDVSETDSKVEYGLNPDMKIQNGLAFLYHLFENHIAFLKLDFLQNLYDIKTGEKKTNFDSIYDKRYTYSNINKNNFELKNNKGRKRQSVFITGNEMNKFQKEYEKKKSYHRASVNYSIKQRIEAKKRLEKERNEQLLRELKENIEEESSRLEMDPNENTFIQLDRIGDINKPVDKSQLVEYDLFYKEQFFKNDVFKYDVNNIEDKEEKEINREMHKLDVKQRLIAKKKEKEVNALKGLDTEDLDFEIEELEKEYKKAKTIERPKLDMIMNNTEGLLHKGRMLECYFIGRKDADFPRFALESEKEIGAKEVIDFKPLRKEEQARRYFDYCICLKERRNIHKCLIYTRFWMGFFIDNWIFENISLMAIVANTIILLISDPTNPNNLGNQTEQYFLFFYTFEAALKIICFTFISAEDAYIKDYWNILDFFVVIIGWISWSLERVFKSKKMSGLAGLRAFRILRPLKALKSVKGLKKLATALLASIIHLGETTIILFFVFLIFALAGRQMWQGNFYKRCMNINFGYFYSTQGSEYMCSFDSDCEDLNSYGVKYICARGYINPDSGAINFNNILTGFVTIFVMASLEGWTNVFTYVSKTFKDKIYINQIIVFFYFHFFIFCCSFYLINLFLAVTNSEFEHIESERKSLIEKKSFFQLIKAKYDLKEREKISKKEKEKKLKENNSKKSDQALQDLYVKVKEEAFHIKKNKRTIPILYSTVKDMYIMSNDNPEELYLQSLRIKAEEKFLSKDISRRQKEIDELIKAKREEMKKSQKDRAMEEKNILLSKSNTQISKTNMLFNNINNFHNNIKKSNLQNNLNNNLSSNLNGNLHNNIQNNIHNEKKTFSNTIKKNIKNNENESITEEVRKYTNKINKELIKDSIDRTQKYIKEKTINITKKIQKVGEEDKDRSELRKKLEKKGKKKMEFYQIIMEEDLPYEKEIRKMNELKKGNESKIKYQNQMNKAMKVEQEKEVKRGSKVHITDALSFMSDLSLSNMEKSLLRENDIVKVDSSESFDNISYMSKNDILISDKKDIGFEEEKFEQKVNFLRPSSILESVIKLKNDREIQKKLKILQEKFHLSSFLRKEMNKGTNISKVGKRRSFLKFLKYTQEPKDLDDFFLNYQKRGSSINNISLFDSNKFEENNIINNNENDSINNDNNEENSLLSSDSYLSMSQNLSINDIDLIPREIKDDKIMMINSKEKDNISKLLKSNKLTKNIRESIFDRTAINTNIELTTEEQSRFLKKINRILNRNLFPDDHQPRGRKKDKLDISHIASEKNYQQVLQEMVESSDSIVTTENKSRNQSSQKIMNIKEFKSSITKKFIKNNLEKINDSSNDYDDSNFNFGFRSAKSKMFDKSTMNLSLTSHSRNETNNIDKKIKSNDNAFYIFKAKSIEKNLDKYPKENTTEFLVREENKPYKDPLTIKQEGIPDNLRGKKYYLNYLFNISDKDLKVKDHFKVDHWSSEILGIKKKFFKKKPLPESVKAFFVFNDKKLNLKRYKYFYHIDLEYKEEECSYLTHQLKYLPRSILETMPLRIRDFGKFAVGKEIKLGALGNKSTILLSEVSHNKSQIKSFDPRSGRAFAGNPRNKSTIVMCSSFANNYKTQEEIKYKRNLYERAYKKVDELNYRTLSNFFTDEEKFYSKLIDERRRAEKIRELEIYNNEKENKLEAKSEISNIKIYDLKTNSSRYVQWSGPDVLKNANEDNNRRKWNKLIKSLEDFNVIIWSENGTRKKWQKLRYAFYIFATDDYFDFIVLGIVIINSIFMALDGNLLKPENLEKLNVSYYIFNSIFILEYVVKFIGLGPLVYYSDPFTYLDTFIIAFALTDFCLPSNTEGNEQTGAQVFVANNISFIRVFRIFRILRIAKVLRRLKSMRLIIVSMTKAITNVAYIVAILIMFILIFELLGMSLLSENYHYKTFGEGFYITYQVLTMENWDGLLYELWNMNEIIFIYYATWIFLGNYIIFNLFTSVLLQAFAEEEKDFDLSEDEIIENMYSLPDYLYNLKKAEQEHTKIISNQKRKATLVKELFKADLNDNISRNIGSSTYIGSQSKDLNKSIIEDSVKISGHNTVVEESDEKNDDENNEESSEQDSNKYYSEVEKNMRYWQKINKLFRKNDCENSIYFLSQTNNFRIFCMKLINNKWFDKFILLMIIFSTARLIIDTFLSGYRFVLIFDFIDTFFNVIFLLEAIIKICALGFALDEGSYLSDNWNKIDIIIVICSIFDYENIFEKYVIGGEENSSSQFLKVLRLLRIVRPLRLISHNMKLKLILTSLFDSIIPIFNALFILIIIFYIFSIVGISVFYENFHNCYILKNGEFDLAIDSFEDSLVENKVKNDIISISNFCANKYNGIMDTGPSFKFSNIGTSLITSYVLSTQEGWPDIMSSYRIYDDSYGIFFIVYNLIVSYFFLNLFTGIMFRYFNEAYSKEQKLAPDDKKAPKYYDFLMQVVDANTHYVIWLRPNKGSWKYYLREFVDSNLFNTIIMSCIFLNFISMALNYEGCNEIYEKSLSIANYFFTSIFIIECFLKILAYGFLGYYHTTWNRFDFFIVIASILDIIIGEFNFINSSFLKSFQVIRVLRVLRVLRILRLVKVIKGLDKLIQTLTWSLPSLTNVFFLMIIILGIFSVLGCFFYDEYPYEKNKDKFVYINEYYNLDNFYNAFLLTFRCTTGENWNNIMMELAYIDPQNISDAYAFIYMIVSNFIDAVIILNLFTMVILQQYDEFTNKNYNPIDKFESFVTEFNNSWNKFSSYEDKGFRIKKGLIINFFMDYNWKKLNFPEQGKLEYVKKYITDLKLRSDDEDYIYYHDVICKLIIRQLGSQVDRENPENALIIKTEKKVQEKVKRLIENYIGKKNKKEKSKKNIIITYNPLTSHLYFKASYLYIKTFISYYKENAEFLHQLERNQIDEQIENSQIAEEIPDGNSASNIALSLSKNKKLIK